MTQREVPETDASSVKFKTLGGCKLGISRYPDFEYNADGGKGTGTGRKIGDDDSNGEFSVGFDVRTLYIPPLMSATTRFLGLPLPPFLKIDIVPELFEGIINRKSGKVGHTSFFYFHRFTSTFDRIERTTSPKSLTLVRNKLKYIRPIQVSTVATSKKTQLLSRGSFICSEKNATVITPLYQPGNLCYMNPSKQ